MTAISDSHAVTDVQRVALKIFLENGSVVKPRAIVPIFHRWIQTQAVDGLLIDVADYTHVPAGPSVLLVAHEGHYALDRTDNEPGLLYARTQPLEGAPAERWTRIARMLMHAARLLEQDTTLEDAVRFRSNEIKFIANDRLLAPNDAITLAALRPDLESFLGVLSDGDGWDLSPDTDPAARFTVRAITPKTTPIETLSTRLQSV
ncbi:MAG: hypothetical protein VYE68_16945 [Acidobacteriota bacterium]|nr:hypothetical protein [Acidobacteriota bacterium]